MSVTEVDFNKLIQQLYQCGSVEAKALYIKSKVKGNTNGYSK
jgi:hypothetical protein